MKREGQYFHCDCLDAGHLLYVDPAWLREDGLVSIEIVSYPLPFLERIKGALRVLFGDMHTNHEIILDREELARLSGMLIALQPAATTSSGPCINAHWDTSEPQLYKQDRAA